MGRVVKLFTFLCLLVCVETTRFSQEKASLKVGFRVGAGSSVATQHFFINQFAFNLPTTSFIHVGLSTNIIERNNKSLFIGLDLHGLVYYPTPTVKSTLAFFSLLVGKSSKYNINPWLYLKQTNGLSLNTLAEATSSSAGGNTNVPDYTGGPTTNLNAGAFTNLQVLFTTSKRRYQSIDYGLGFDIAYKGFHIYRNRTYPTYLNNNLFLQYGININMNYNF